MMKNIPKSLILFLLFSFLSNNIISAACSIDSIKIINQSCVDASNYKLTLRVYTTYDSWDFLDVLTVASDNGGTGGIDYSDVDPSQPYPIPYFDVPVFNLSTTGCPENISFDVFFYTDEDCSDLKTFNTTHDALDCTPIAAITSIEPLPQDSDMHLPDGFTFQYIIEEDYPLTAGGTLPDRTDFTGYVPINGSSEKAYLSINSETTPGGVSILDIEFDLDEKKWNILYSEAVDFTDVAGTQKNCSGTVTPWNTIITCEEQVVTTDSNSDGYYDMGWAIEIDPATKSVINNQKLWALGNFKHENAVIHPNHRTVYQGIDANIGYLYKFVADNPQDLSSGDLYVYKGPKNGIGNWIPIDNTTPTQRNTVVDSSTNLGATIFKGIEDVEYNPVDGWFYFAVKNDSTVYRFQDLDPLTDTAPTVMETYVGGTGVSYSITHPGGTTIEPWGKGNDNLAFDPDGNLYVLQDGDENHIWLVENGHTQMSPKVKLFGRSPTGSEPTGITFSPDYRFLFMSFQHPAIANSSTSQVDAFGNRKYFNKDVSVVIAREKNLGDNTCVNIKDNGTRYINSGIYQANQKVISQNKISPLMDVLFRANDCVELLEGFEVSPGAIFEAHIDACDNN